ncbi:Crp/Fnr family transcriptional regulator [Corynebacterium sp.]|uniref:Crp/Fnr family transcriptional regulator n=1 Tax=Corynebacterium sp. TaxID=1720 RepID=UPI0026DD771D|nr:Crp/Fnr family transcriptional regulator [Corynebacterium sp.]MDO5032439.1 Crp/Fnr family transcriptional regulator [Corynebacterium sp.]
MASHVSGHCSTPHTCPPQVCERVMAHSPLTRGLDPAARRDFDSHVISLAWEEGSAIYTQGEALHGLYMVMSGIVRLSQSTAEGDEVTVDMCGPGDVLGSMVLGEPTAALGAWATTTVCCLFLPADKLSEVVTAHPPLAVALLHLQQRRLRESQTRKVQDATSRVRVRVLDALRYLDEKFGRTLADSTRLVDAPIRREDVAGLAGTTVESTSRAMSALVKRGVLAPGRQKIQLLAPLPKD